MGEELHTSQTLKSSTTHIGCRVLYLKNVEELYTSCRNWLCQNINVHPDGWPRHTNELLVGTQLAFKRCNGWVVSQLQWLGIPVSQKKLDQTVLSLS